MERYGYLTEWGRVSGTLEALRSRASPLPRLLGKCLSLEASEAAWSLGPLSQVSCSRQGRCRRQA